jgi:hypothetical protein
LSIPGLTHQPEHAFVGEGQRKSLKAAAAICLAGGVYAQELTGTLYQGCALRKQYLKSDGEPYSKMGGEEYTQFIMAAMSHFMTETRFRRQVEAAILIHDRDTAHTCKATIEKLQQIGLKSMLAPPRSPDLDPLDYGIWPTQKTALERCFRPGRTWDQKAHKFMELIREAPIMNTIREFPKRLEAVIRAGGKHIDQALNEIKHEQKV